MYLDFETYEEALKLLKKYPYTTKRTACKRLIKNLMFSKPLYLDHFSWPNGLLAIGIEYWEKVDPQERLLNKLQSYYKMWADKKYKIVSQDDMLTAYTLLYLYERNSDINLLSHADRCLAYLEHHRKTTTNILPYRAGQPDEVYVDTIGIVVPFLSRYARVRKNQKAARMATDQIIAFLEHGMDAKTMLPYHGYRVSDGTKQGIVGWGRACGWLLIGMIEYLIEIRDTQYHELFPGEYVRIREAFTDLMQTVETYRSRDGLFHWQLQAKEGPIDTSATAFIRYALLRGAEEEFLNRQHSILLAQETLQSLARLQCPGGIGNCSGECEGFGQYPQNYTAFPWSLGLAIASDSILERLKKHQEGSL